MRVAARNEQFFILNMFVAGLFYRRIAGTAFRVEGLLMSSNIAEQIKELRSITRLQLTELAQVLGTSLVAIDRWERGDVEPSPKLAARITRMLIQSRQGVQPVKHRHALQEGLFASRGATRRALKATTLDLFSPVPSVSISDLPHPPLLSRMKHGRYFGRSKQDLASILRTRKTPAQTTLVPATGGASAGKNTYTYDAHTYHTKVPPQGIVEFLHHYLPKGGVVLDLFGGSGMTGVAARMTGCDVVLNELSPAACFISHNFTETLDPDLFVEAMRTIRSNLQPLRERLYTTDCRECGKRTEILYAVWSYFVTCPQCQHEFRLWDYCRSYGKTVREHKILAEFPCPACERHLKKSSLIRSNAEPVLLGYKCCSRQQIEHALNEKDLELVQLLESAPPLAKGYYPQTPLPEGVNLNQPRKHGLTTIDKFYAKRNLAALSHLWREIHRIDDEHLASMLGFVFTSLYQRVTRLSEYRFWGGSGNTAHFNVPFIFNEANVFVTFERKAASILDHLETTAVHYKSRKAVVCNSATDLDYLPDESVDFIFTDPPFGANINYSDMNILWESWLGEFTDVKNEAIVNRVQGKGLKEYEELIGRTLQECFRVLRCGHWMLLVFMNSSGKVWDSLKVAIARAGFVTEKVDIFDKQHGTFKQFVSENTAGCDLVLHCRKPAADAIRSDTKSGLSATESLREFLAARAGTLPTTVYLHVSRETEPDMRRLYSEWVAFGLLHGHQLTDFATFRSSASAYLNG